MFSFQKLLLERVGKDLLGEKRTWKLAVCFSGIYTVADLPVAPVVFGKEERMFQ